MSSSQLLDFLLYDFFHLLVLLSDYAFFFSFFAVILPYTKSFLLFSLFHSFFSRFLFLALRQKKKKKISQTFLSRPQISCSHFADVICLLFSQCMMGFDSALNERSIFFSICAQKEKYSVAHLHVCPFIANIFLYSLLPTISLFRFLQFQLFHFNRSFFALISLRYGFIISIPHF